MKAARYYDVIVIGAGHAGVEAALAAARTGCRTLLITFDKNLIGALSCNPAVGGVGKGQLVKEMDALGGELGRATDAAGIQFRVLNTSKGPAVQSSRVQVDRDKFRDYIQNVLRNQPNLEILEGEVSGLDVKNDTVRGVITAEGKTIAAAAVILAPGTFFHGLIHVGMKTEPGGRVEEKRVSAALPEELARRGFRIMRFKTGTCARIDGSTISIENLRPQYGDEPPHPFSFSTGRLQIKQVPCYITHTNQHTHEIIRKNLDRSPLFTGKITGTGVRYCPSLEDKVVKFPHHEQHHVFLEPETSDGAVYYPNGISTSLPTDVQDEFIRTIPGLEKVRIIRYGYGIEHDVLEATQLFPTLETKLIRNLYAAGQINGTTGYEEAAAQGLIAGINASLKVRGKPQLILDRATAYIGVLIDDLTTKGTNEPYRMFTSRVEYRLMLREDNADLRLREFGYQAGLVSEEQKQAAEEKKELIEKAVQYLKKHRIRRGDTSYTLHQYLRRPEVTIKDIAAETALPFADDVLMEAEISVKCRPYFERQLADIKDFRNLEKIKIPVDFDYRNVSGLSLEVREKLTNFRPLNLGQAGRISGVTPAAVVNLMMHLRKRET